MEITDRCNYRSDICTFRSGEVVTRRAEVLREEQSLLVNSMEKWKVMLYSGNFELGEVEIKRGIFQGDSLSPLVFVLALILLSLILRKAKAAYEFSESKEKINHLLFMDDLKLYSQS